MGQKPYIKIGAQNVTYDGRSLSHYFNILGIKYQAYPDITINAANVPGRPGGRFGSRELGSRNIVLSLSFKGYDRNPMHVYQVWRKLLPLLMKDEPKPLVLDESKTIYAVVSSVTDLETISNRGFVEVTLTATDPFFYGTKHVIPLVSGSNKFKVLGDYAVRPLIEITNVSGALDVTNNNTSERIHIPQVLSTSAKVTIDTDRLRCEANGSYLECDLTVSDYFQLDPGMADIQISRGSGTLTYQELFL